MTYRKRQVRIRRKQRVPNLLTIKSMSAKHPDQTKGRLKKLVFNSKDRWTKEGQFVPANGLDIAIVRQGRKLFIDEDMFFYWMKQQNSTSSN